MNNILPYVLEKIVNDYRNDLELNEKVKKLNEEFKNTYKIYTNNKITICYNFRNNLFREYLLFNNKVKCNIFYEFYNLHYLFNV